MRNLYGHLYITEQQGRQTETRDEEKIQHPRGGGANL